MRVAAVLCLSLVTCLPVFISCPAAQAQGEVEDPLAQVKPTAALTATLTAAELSGAVLTNKGSHTLNITVVNRGKRTLVLDGDNVTLSMGKATQGAMPMDKVVSPPAKHTFPEDAVEVVGSIGTLGVVPVVVDTANKATHPGPAFYGKDETRREVAGVRFGKRLLFPGETSSGELYLRKAVKAPVTGQLAIPVSTYPDDSEVGKLILSVSLSPPISKPHETVPGYLPR